MKILLDLRLCTDPWTGMGRYGLEVTAALARMQRHELVALLPYGRDRPPALVAAGLRVVRTVPTYHPAEHLLIAAICRRFRVDHLHAFTYAFPLFAAVAGTLTMFDLVPELFPEHYRKRAHLYWRHIVARTVHRVRRVVTLSETVRRQIVARFDLQSERVTVAGFGVGPPFEDRPLDDDPAIISRLGVHPPYILSHGNGRPHKNLDALIAAFASLRRERHVSLVLSGCPVQRRQSDGIVHVGRVDDATLAALYRQASSFVLPSLYEGAGLPPLEAMASGTAVVVSDRGALPEHYSGAALITDPTPAGLAQAMRRILDEPQLRATLVAAGRDLAQRRTWAEAGRSLNAILEAAHVRREVAAR